MMQEEPQPDIEAMTEDKSPLTDAEHGAQIAVDVTKGAPVDTSKVDYDSMPLSTNIEDRRGEGPTAGRSTGQGGQLFDSGNTDVAQLTDYLQSLNEGKGKEPGFTHPPEVGSAMDRLFSQIGAGKTAEWGAYTGLAALAPDAMHAVNAAWMGAWIASGHALRADVAKQVREGKSIDQIEFKPGSLGDLGGIISKLKEKYK